MVAFGRYFDFVADLDLTDQLESKLLIEHDALVQLDEEPFVTKSSYYTSSNKLLWTVHLSGDFSYNLVLHPVVLNTSYSISNLGPNWSVKSPNQLQNQKIPPHAKVTMHQKGGGDCSKELTLTCDKNGKLK